MPPVELISGFHEAEKDGHETFWWMAKEAELSPSESRGGHYIEFQVCSAFFDLSQELTVESGGRRETFPLVEGWSPVSARIPDDGSVIRLTLNKAFPVGYHPDDDRELGVRVRRFQVHGSASRHEAVERQNRNAILNTREMLEGKVVMDSSPRGLGIDLYGVCNVKPPCVYCEWDFSKKVEGENVHAPFNLDTLSEYGEMFDNCGELINCSIGEPFMMKDFDGLLDAFGEQGKMLEMTTNGQILTERNIQRLLGRNMHLYISLDAATAKTYAQFRNDKFDRVVGNIRRLIAAKGGPGRLPFVYLVFMPMKANLHELDAFVDLAAELQIDRLVLRKLNDVEGTTLVWDRGGYHFDYLEEILDFRTLVRAAGRATERCRKLGVALSNQMDFGEKLEDLFAEEFEQGRQETLDQFAVEQAQAVPDPVDEADESSDPVLSQESNDELKLEPEALPSLGKEKMPACTEPWNRLYILRRGVTPCCYGNPIADMKDYRAVWNGPVLRGIRAALAKGKFHKYCLDCEICPVTQKARERGELPPRRVEEPAPAPEPFAKKSMGKRLADWGKTLVGRT